MQIAKWIREHLGGEREDGPADVPEPTTSTDDDEHADETDDDPSVYPLW